jgi:hypothetical protein
MQVDAGGVLHIKAPEKRDWHLDRCSRGRFYLLMGLISFARPLHAMSS